MNYNEFAKAFREQIKSYLPAEFKEAEVQTINVKKNNDVEKEGVSMNYSPEISVVFYPEDLYIPYQYGIPFEEIMQKAARGFLDSIISEEQVSATNFGYDAIKDKLLVAVCNAEKNTELLQYIPHEIRENFALIYKVFMGIDDDGDGFITVNNNLMEIWGIDREELQKQAWENMHKRLPYNLRTIETVLNKHATNNEIDEKYREKLRQLAKRSDLYVLTNEANVFGASYMFDYELLDKIARKLGGDFMVIPSSVHEVLVKKVEADTSVDMVKGIIWKVNREELRPEEFLSDELYVFDSIEKKLSIANVQDMWLEENDEECAEAVVEMGENPDNDGQNFSMEQSF